MGRMRGTSRDGVVAALVIVAVLVSMGLVAWVLPDILGGPREQVPGSGVGFAQAYGPTFQSHADLDRDFDAIAASGARWVRFDFIWSVIQADGPDEFDWRTMDRAVRAAHERGLRVLATLAYTPEWARPPGATSDKFAPARLSDFTRFARAAATRYAPRGVHAFEIWNEPNTGFWSPKPDPARYTKMLRRAYVAIHRVDDRATVVSGSLAAQGPELDWVADDGGGMSPFHFLHAMYASGAHGFFDAMGSHPYGLPGPTVVNAANAFGQTPALHREMSAHGDGHRLIWGTEAGAYTGSADGAVSEPVQAQYVVDYVTLWHAWPYTGPLFIYALRDRSRNAAESEDNFGVLRVDYSHKDAYDALRHAIA